VARANKLPWPTGGVFSRKSCAADLDIAVVGQLSAAQLPLSDHLEPRALEMERLDAPLRRRTLIEEPLEDATRYPDRAFVGPRITENSTQSRLSFQDAFSGNSKNSIA
jgi:hypothetical protein